MTHNRLSSPLPRRLVGRMAAVLMISGAIISVSAEVVSGHFRTEMLLTGGLSVALGVALWFVPWERLGSTGTVGFFLLGISALILGGLASSEEPHPEALPAFLMVLFAWNGLAHTRWTSLKLAPLVALVYLAPLIFDDDPVSGTFGMAFALPLALLLGETIAWITDKLTTAENERLLLLQRRDLLTAAQHELRTPVTSISGSSKLLRDRWNDLDADQREQLLDGIVRGAVRMERLLQQMSDVERIKLGDRPDLDGMGLLAAHFGDGEIDPSRPERASGAGLD